MVAMLPAASAVRPRVANVVKLRRAPLRQLVAARRVAPRQVLRRYRRFRPMGFPSRRLAMRVKAFRVICRSNLRPQN